MGHRTPTRPRPRQDPPRHLSGAAAAVQVWWAAVDSSHVERLSGVISPVERAKAEAFARAADHDRSVVAAGLVRQVLGAATGTDPALLDVRRSCSRCGGPHGRPFVPGGADFSVSHAGSWVVLAVSAVARVGVDIEEESHDWAGIAGQVLAPRERADPAALGSVWVAKEAYLKALGCGLEHPLDRVVVEDDRVGSDTGPPGVLGDLTRRDGLVGAVCVLGQSTLLLTEQVWEAHP